MIQPVLQFKHLLRKNPYLRSVIRKARFALWKNKIAFISNLHSDEKAINPLLWVDPKKIMKVGVGWGKYKKYNKRFKIVRGNWDLNTMPFEHLDVYQAFKLRFIHGLKWEDTSYYKSFLDRISKGEKLYGIINKEELTKRLENLDDLFENIRKYGYKMQQQLLGDRYNPYFIDEVSVRISRYGEFLFEDGRHRLAIAKILGLKKIPILVTRRHRDWHLLREQILYYAKRCRGGKTYQPLTHPDLTDIPSSHGDIRFNLIRSNLQLKNGSLLDIGANWGYFCHRFEEEGFHCCAVEKSWQNFYFLNKLRIAECRRFTVVHTDILNILEKNEYDVVLALNVFHHFLKTRNDYENLIKFLQRLRSKVIFFEPHLTDEAQMQGAFKNFNCEDFVRFVANHTGLRSYKCIGYGEEGRPLFKMTRS